MSTISKEIVLTRVYTVFNNQFINQKNILVPAGDVSDGFNGICEKKSLFMVEKRMSSIQNYQAQFLFL